MPAKTATAPSSTKPAQRSRWLDHMPLDKIIGAEVNDKDHDEEFLAASISTFGLIDNMALDERTGRLIAGHGRLFDLQRRRDAGEEPPDGVERGTRGVWLVPVQRGWASRSDDEATAVRIGLNKIVERGGWKRSLTDTLDELSARAPDLLEMTGFSTAALEELSTKWNYDDALGALDTLKPQMSTLNPNGAQVDGERTEYTQITFVMTHEQRDTVLAALRQIKDENDLADISDALVWALTP